MLRVGRARRGLGLPRIISLSSPLHNIRHVHSSRTPKPASPRVTGLLLEYSQLPPRPIPLKKLLQYSPATPSSVLESAAYVRSEIPRRLALALRRLDKLPFIVGTNPFISRTYSLYIESFASLASVPPIESLEENEAFAKRLEGHVQSHANDIPTISKGFTECAKYMSPEATTYYLDAAISSRIGIRLIAEQHIALTRALTDPDVREDHIGIVDLACSPIQMINMCSSFVSSLCDATLGASPEVIVDGVTDARFPYVPVHLEYILTELLKNSFRATVESHFAKHGTTSSLPLPPVTITVSPSLAYLSLRIRDEGGGISPQAMDRVFSYAYTTAGRSGENGVDDDDLDETGGGPYAAQHVGGSAAVGGDIQGAGDGNLFGEITGKGLQVGMGTIAGLGYGLPLARLYAKYFGGSLELVSLHGYGTDAFIKLRRLHQGADVEI